MELAKNDEKLVGKPEAALAKIVEGKVNKQLKEVCLLEQPFVKDPNVTVGQLIEGKLKINKFIRYTLGEGLEKRSENFPTRLPACTRDKKIENFSKSHLIYRELVIYCALYIRLCTPACRRRGFWAAEKRGKKNGKNRNM